MDVFTQSMIILKMDHLEDLSILSLTSFVVCTFFRKKNCRISLFWDKILNALH